MIFDEAKKGRVLYEHYTKILRGLGKPELNKILLSTKDEIKASRKTNLQATSALHILLVCLEDLIKKD